MKKKAIIAALILLISLLACGCAQKKTEQGATPTPAKTAASTPAPKSNVSSVTQNDLDQLKADIEKMEAEDLGGL